MITSHRLRTLTFKAAANQLKQLFRSADDIHTEGWQGVDVTEQPAAKMKELLNVHLHIPQVPRDLEALVTDLEGYVNLPWAERHFHERVCGYPINPGVEWENWPDGDSARHFLNDEGQFNHNYMERYWPKRVLPSRGATRTVPEFLDTWNSPINQGLRHPVGDLEDLVHLLAGAPHTRQAYLPIYFPEDTTRSEVRKPCTLGYQFLLRDYQLHIFYPMRSCDFYRHWGDDCYMTIRLGHWIIDRLRSIDSSFWNGVRVGSFTMAVTSLHMFINDYHKMMGDRP